MTAAHQASSTADRAGPGKTPGVQYAVVDARSVRAEHHHGVADVASGRAMEAGTSLMVYSMSKTVTAVAVLQLVESGEIGLDDPVTRYVPAQPYGDAVTVRRLLSHTGGLPNPIPLRWVHPVARHATFDERATLDGVLRAHPRLASAPGTKYAYSNIGYWLLGRVVETAAARPFVDYVTERVLRPVGATPDELGYVVADPVTHASGYLARLSMMNLFGPLLIDRELIGEASGRWVRIRDHYVNGPAFGGLVGTASGFAKFLGDQLLPDSLVLGPRGRSLLFEPQTVAGGRVVPMTLGWHVGRMGGTPFLYKEGGGGGFHSMMRLYPAVGVGTVVMANATAFDVKGFLDASDPAALAR